MPDLRVASNMFQCAIVLSRGQSSPSLLVLSPMWIPPLRLQYFLSLAPLAAGDMLHSLANSVRAAASQSAVPSLDWRPGLRANSSGRAGTKRSELTIVAIAYDAPASGVATVGIAVAPRTQLTAVAPVATRRQVTIWERASASWRSQTCCAWL